MVGKQSYLTIPNLSLIWGHLRNLIDFEIMDIPSSVRLVGVVVGEFPVDAYFPVFLEVSKKYRREDLSGRFNCSGSKAGQDLYSDFWHPVRNVPLPIYRYEPNMSMQNLLQGYGQLLIDWDNSFIPDNIPCAAIALKTSGNYCDEREAQWLVVLLIYPNLTARLMFLDFFEGAMDDCISPEWYSSVSKLMSVETAIQKLGEASKNLPNWQRPLSSISTIPNFLGNFLVGGRKIETSERKWDFEWTYERSADLTDDLDLLLNEIRTLFT